MSNESGREDVFVRPYPGVDSDKVKVSPAGGTGPTWNAAGSELYYRQGPSIVRVTFKSLQDFGESETVQVGGYADEYDAAPGRDRFLMIAYADSGGLHESQSVIVVENWAEEVRRSVPID